jgi:hypothetical protein
MTELSQNYKFDFDMKSQELDELRKQKKRINDIKGKTKWQMRF